MKQLMFRLFWLRESGCDAGTLVSAGELPQSISRRVLELAGSGCGELSIRLPFYDRKECRRQHELLAALPFERAGSLIRAVLDPVPAARDLAATLAFTDATWAGTPSERDPQYFSTWQRVSLVLQRWLRDRIAGMYFHDIARLHDRAAAYPMIVYQASRPCFGHARSEFTYDLRDYPDCRDTLATSWKMMGRPMQRALAPLEQRLLEAGYPQLAHRYAPVWHEDVLIAVQKNAKPYAELLSRESAIINAVIGFGTDRSVDSINRLARVLNQSLRRVHGQDMRRLATGMIEEAHRALSQESARGAENVADMGTDQRANVVAAGRPDGWIGFEKNGDDGSAYGGGQVGDA
jgi:hypothetical protein